MWTGLWREVSAAGVFAGSPPIDHVTQAELDELPPAARSYMNFFGVVPGSGKDWSFRLEWTGRFRRTPDEHWMPIEAAQYDLRAPVGRFFHMKAQMRRIFPVRVQDTYVYGRGHMLAKVAGILKVADGSGKEFDEGELVTWVNDVVLFAPTMLLGSSARWWHLDDRRFGVAFSDGECTVKARVAIDSHGAPIDFETTDRYLNDPFDPAHPLVRGQWSTPIDSWDSVHGHPIPTLGRATWHLGNGDFTYGEFEPLPASLAFNVQPAAVTPRAAA